MRGAPKRLPIYKHFNLCQALEQLEIWLRPDTKFEDGVIGWAEARSIAVKPGSSDPVYVAFHEMAHIILPRRSGRINDRTTAVLEVEIELTAFLVKRCLGSKIYLSHGRDYIQSRMKKAHP